MAKYLVSRDGAGAPRHEHDSYASAYAEAQRLAAEPSNKVHKFRILKQVAYLEPQIGHRLVVEDQQELS